MKKWNNPEIAELNISETAKKPLGWNEWTCPYEGVKGICQSNSESQNWGQCQNCQYLMTTLS